MKTKLLNSAYAFCNLIVRDYSILTNSAKNSVEAGFTKMYVCLLIRITYFIQAFAFFGSYQGR